MTADDLRPRRTQRERREATIAKLVDATIDAIGDLGYQHATVQEICGRAGLSVGAMFRQFDSRLELIVRTGDEIVQRQLDMFRAAMAGLGDGDDALRMALWQLRAVQRSAPTEALREIFVAARSDAELRVRIAPAAQRYYSAVIEEVERSGLLRRFPDPLREPLFFLVLHMFSGEAMLRGVYPRPDLEDTLIDLTMDLLLRYADFLPGASEPPT